MRKIAVGRKCAKQLTWCDADEALHSLRCGGDAGRWGVEGDAMVRRSTHMLRPTGALVIPDVAKLHDNVQ